MPSITPPAGCAAGVPCAQLHERLEQRRVPQRPAGLLQAGPLLQLEGPGPQRRVSWAAPGGGGGGVGGWEGVWERAKLDVLFV